MSPPASITSAPSATSGAISSRSDAIAAEHGRSSGAPAAPPAASGTDSRSTTDDASSPSTPPSAEGPGAGFLRRAGDRAAALAGTFREILLGELSALRGLLPAPRPDLGEHALRAWPRWTGDAFPHPGPNPPWHLVLSLFAYEGPVREGIRAAKYAGRSGAAAPFAAALAEAIRGPWAGLFPDGFRPTIVPVPIRPLKYLRRGYNLPALVGRALAGPTGWPTAAALLRRTSGSRPQAGLPFRERSENVRGAFRAAPGARPPRDILLLDDVFTSGATASACAVALKRAGAETIVVLTVARTVL